MSGRDTPPITAPADDVIGVGGRDLGPRPATRKLVRALANPRRLLRALTRRRGYREGWDYLASDRTTAYHMVDSSRDEAELTRRGAAVAARLAEALLVEPAHTVLEIGCGPARIGRELAPRCGRWVGADISPEMIRRARARTAHLPNVAFAVLPGASLAEFDDASFDRVYCHSVLVHLDKEDLYKYLVEIARVLRPSGLAYVDTWNLLHEQSWRWFRDSTEAAPLHGRKLAWRPQFATTAELRRFIEAAGLVEVLLDDASHLLQAFVTVAPPGASAADLARRLRDRLAGHVPAIRGID